jgi:hypothetical protein
LVIPEIKPRIKFLAVFPIMARRKNLQKPAGHSITEIIQPRPRHLRVGSPVSVGASGLVLNHLEFTAAVTAPGHNDLRPVMEDLRSHMKSFQLPPVVADLILIVS